MAAGLGVGRTRQCPAVHASARVRVVHGPAATSPTATHAAGPEQATDDKSALAGACVTDAVTDGVAAAGAVAEANPATATAAASANRKSGRRNHALTTFPPGTSCGSATEQFPHGLAERFHPLPRGPARLLQATPGDRRYYL